MNFIVTCLNCFQSDELQKMTTIRDSENELVILCKQCIKEILSNEGN